MAGFFGIAPPLWRPPKALTLSAPAFKDAATIRKQTSSSLGATSKASEIPPCPGEAGFDSGLNTIPMGLGIVL